MSSVGLSIRPSLGWQQPWTASEAVFEAKFMLPWSFSEEMAAEKYHGPTPAQQVGHQFAVLGAVDHH
jgi:hypothetical protein